MHKVPVHLDTQDTFLWNLTFRQVLILFVGGGMTYIVITTDWSTPLTALLCVLFGGITLVATLLVAFVRIAHRNLDQWCLLAFLYYSSSQRYLWSALSEQDTSDRESHKQVRQEKGEEEW
jgi:hypothetical protein